MKPAMAVSNHPPPALPDTATREALRLYENAVRLVAHAGAYGQDGVRRAAAWLRTEAAGIEDHGSPDAAGLRAIADVLERVHAGDRA